MIDKDLQIYRAYPTMYQLHQYQWSKPNKRLWILLGIGALIYAFAWYVA